MSLNPPGKKANSFFPWPHMIDIVEKAYHENAQLADTFSDIRLASLGNDAGIIGCAGVAIHAAK